MTIEESIAKIPRVQNYDDWLLSAKAQGLFETIEIHKDTDAYSVIAYDQSGEALGIYDHHARVGYLFQK